MDAYYEGWWMEVFNSFGRATGPAELFAISLPFVEQLGFTWCSYGIRFPAPTITVFDSYPRDWMAHYRCSNYLAIDPTVQLGMRESTAILWSDEVFAPAPQLWQDAKDRGLRVGVGQAAWSSLGAYGLLSVARDAEPLRCAELAYVRPRLKWLAENVHSRMQALLAGNLASSLLKPLSAREREVLVWTAEGKTSWETGKILKISSSTVNFHINNILIKLKAQNKIQATVTAVMLGLIDGLPRSSFFKTTLPGARRCELDSSAE